MKDILRKENNAIKLGERLLRNSVKRFENNHRKGTKKMAKRLSEGQIAAIEYLALPGKGGLDYQQIAEKIGVHDRTLLRWRNDDFFHAALTRKIVRDTTERLPDVLASVPDHIINNGNAAMLRTFLQAHGLLTERVLVDNKGGNESVDMDEIKAEIQRLKDDGTTTE